MEHVKNAHAQLIAFVKVRVENVQAFIHVNNVASRYSGFVESPGHATLNRSTYVHT